MCGIAGVYSARQPVDLNIFKAMVDTLASRGPDGSGVKILAEGRLCLGHRRLSIIDLSEAGSQPMSNEDSSAWLTYNGEIYNYIALRKELESCGHKFRSHSDSETIIHSYEQWGTACVHRFRGIFAFAIYDCRERSLFMARDHVGVKPLYYYRDSQKFVFASQPRAILASEGFHAKIEKNSFSLFLAYGNIPGEYSIYENIHKLLPGHWLILKDGIITIHKYWELNYLPIIKDAREAEKVIFDKVSECVRIQTISDVPIGTLLSGGIDSTIITSIVSNNRNERLSAFTLGFDERDSDEREYARYIADYYGTKHYESVLNYSNACKLLPNIVEAYDEPFHFNGLFPFYALSRLVENTGRKVVLGGDGGDELFAGYLWYDQFNSFFDSKRPRSFLEILLSNFGFNKLDNQTSPIEIYFGYNGFFGQKAQESILGGAVPRPTSELYSPLSKHWRPDLPPVLAGQLLDFNCFLVDHCLTKVDRASMACGVEVRVPFLDFQLVELVFSIDHNVIFQQGERKALLKRALSHCLPPAMDTTRKKGFSSPLNIWLNNGFAKAGRNLLLNGSLSSRELINSDAIRTGYSEMNSGNQLLLISAELWCRRWMENDPAAVEDFAAGLAE